MSKKGVHILLSVVLCCAAILRLWHPLAIPYSYDELSALSRTHFDSFSELIDKGVRIDAHPAGIQVFLYYWVMIFGYGEFIVKLPFIICGILSVYFIFRIAKDWFNPTVALVSAAYLATLEYTIMYSQEARPYVTGLLFTLLMVFYWNKVVFRSSEHFMRNLALYVLFSALCAYNHHFSLLMAAIVGVTGLLFLKQQYIWKYALAGLCIFILYIPHLDIFMYQLQVGGVGGPNGWLSRPHLSFIPKFLGYVLHFSWYVYLLTGALLLFSCYTLVRTKAYTNKYLLISFGWFFALFSTGFLYSILENPVLQYSVLIFGFPFMLFCLFGSLPQLSTGITAAVVAAICAVNTFSLVHGREYYHLFYKAPYEQEIAVNDSISKSLGKDVCASIIQADDSDKNSSALYIQKYKASGFLWLDADLNCYATHKVNDFTKLIAYLQKEKRPYMAFGCVSQVDPNVLPILLDYYPYLVKKWDFYNGNFYLLTKNKANGSDYPSTFKSVDGYEQPDSHWEEASKSFLNDSIALEGKHSYKIDSAHEWAPAFSGSVDDIVTGKNDFVDISVSIHPMGSMKDVDMVAQFNLDTSIVNWTATPASYFVADTVRHGWITIHHTVKLSDTHFPKGHISLKAYIWNRGKKNFYMDNFRVQSLQGNPVVYGLFEKI